MNKPATCDPKPIELFLAQQLSDEEQTALELHLDDCSDCRRRLETAAAGDDIWSGVRDSLRGEEPMADGPHLGDASLDSAAGGDTSFSHTTVLKLLAPTDNERMLGRLGTYEIVGVVGSGGMGVVLKAFDAALNRYVAIKVLAPHLGSSGAARKRFSREAQAAAAVVHDNVMEIHGVADVSGLPYLVMPYVRGPSLQRRLDDDGPLGLVEILRIGMQAASGLAAAHAQGLVHRDVKPANILLADGVERVKLTDFGLARAADDASLTKTGIIAGTPQYMSPEQARGDALDARSDLFSLGSVLYAMCTGRPPFRADTSYGILRRITDTQPRPIRELNPNIPEWLCTIIGKLMSKQAEDRYASVEEVALLLEACLAHVQQPTTVPLPESVAPPTNHSRIFSGARRSSGVAVMIAAVVAGLVGIALWQAATGPDADENGRIPGAPAAPTQSAQAQAREPAAKATEAAPKRLHHFANITIGHVVQLAYSADGKMLAVANGNPTMIMHGGGRSSPKDGWKASVNILDAATGKTLVSLEVTSADEDAVLAATPRISHVEATAVAFSPDGKLVAVGTSIGQVKLYNAPSGELLRSLDDDVAKLADQETPENWKTLKRAMGNVAALAFSPDGSQLATCGASFADFADRFDGVDRLGFRGTGPGRLKLWDVETGALKHDLAGHNDQAFAVAFSPDGQYLASAGRWHDERERFGNGVILWSARTGDQIHKLIRSTANAGVRAIAFSPDSKRLALGTQRFGDDDAENPSTGGVSVVQVSSGIEQWLVTVPGWAKPVAFAPDATSVVLCGGRSIRFLHAGTGATKHEIQPDEGQPDVRWKDFAIAPQTGTIAIAGVDKQQSASVEIWSTSAGDNEPAVTPRPTAGESPLQTKAVRDRGYAIRGFDARERYFATEAGVQMLAASEDGTRIALATRPGRTAPQDKKDAKNNAKPAVEILDALTGKTTFSLELFDEEDPAKPMSNVEAVTALALSHDGSLLAVGTSIGQVRLFDARSGKLLHSLDDEAAKLADKETPEKWKSINRAMGSVAALVFSPDGRQLAICGSSFADFAPVLSGARRLNEVSTGPGRLKSWDVETGSLKRDLVGHSHADAVAFSPDGRWLASAGRWASGSDSGGGVIVWDAERGAKHHTISTEVGGTGWSVAFSPDGKLLAFSAVSSEAEQPDETSKSAIGLANVARGVVQWERTISGSAQRIAFSASSLLLLSDGQSQTFFQTETGKTQARINRSANPKQAGRWNDIATAKEGHMWVVAGEDAEGHGIIQVFDPDAPAAGTAPVNVPRRR